MTYPESPVTGFNFRNEGHYKGLTKREYFAAMALQGLLSNPANADYDENDIIQQALYLTDKLIDGLNDKL